MNIKTLLLFCLITQTAFSQIRCMKRSKVPSYYPDFDACAERTQKIMDSAFYHFFKEDINKAGGIDSFEFRCYIDVAVNHDLKKGKIMRINTTADDSKWLCKKYEWENYALFYLPVEYCYSMYPLFGSGCIIDKTPIIKIDTSQKETDEIELGLENSDIPVVEENPNEIVCVDYSFMYSIDIPKRNKNIK